MRALGAGNLKGAEKIRLLLPVLAALGILLGGIAGPPPLLAASSQDGSAPGASSLHLSSSPLEVAGAYPADVVPPPADVRVAGTSSGVSGVTGTSAYPADVTAPFGASVATSSPEERTEVAPASLHTALESSRPEEGAEVEGPVEELQLRFTTAVEIGLSRVELRRADGTRAPSGALEGVPGTDERELILRFDRPLPPGDWTVEWRTVGPDGHPVQGRFGFRVLSPPGVEDPDPVEDPPQAVPPPEEAVSPEEAVPPPLEEMEDPVRAPLAVGIRWVFLLALVGMLGTATFRGLMLPRIGRREELAAALPRLTRSARTVGWMVGALALLALPARLWHQSVVLFGGGALGGGNLSHLIFRTPWGWGWLLFAGAVLLFLGGLAWAGSEGRGRSRAGWALVGLGAALSAVVPALSGHAWGAEELRGVAVASHTLHVAAAGTWMGGLGLLLLAGLPGLRALGGSQAFPGLLSALVEAFSRIALFAVGILVATGVINSWVHLSGIGELLTTAYGRTLSFKILVAFGAFALGFYNWRQVRPALRDTPRPGLLRIPASFELLLAVAVLGITATLLGLSPP